MPAKRRPLAAEPGFHGHSPQRSDSTVINLRHASDHPPKLFEQQSENDLALAQGPTQPLCVVMEDGAGGAAFEVVPGAAGLSARPIYEDLLGDHEFAGSYQAVKRFVLEGILKAPWFNLRNWLCTR